jgi:hypothetical protein
MSKLQAKNEITIKASLGNVWALITDISQFHKINPGLVKATGTMDKLNGTRVCDINNKGKMGTLTERLIELIPEKRTVWTIESDTMGWSKMLKDTRFCFNLEKISETQTKIVNETYYQPANLIARVMNALMMKKMISKAQEQILLNIKTLTEK